MDEQRKKRRLIRIPLILLLFLILLALFFYEQNNRLDVDEIVVSSAEIPVPFDGFRIVQLSDNHGKEFGPDNAVLLDAVRTARPDIIVYTGDLVESKEQYTMVPALAKGLSQIAPTYYVTGNHEWAVRNVPELLSLLMDNGVTVLRNQSALLTQDGASVVLAGVDDPNGPADQKAPEELAEEIEQKYGGLFTILLAHRNNRFMEYAACNFDLVLSGHGHGGIIRLPFTDGLLGTEKNFFPTWTNGLYFFGNSQLVVSRGLGNVGRSIRMFNRPHLPVIVLHADKS